MLCSSDTRQFANLTSGSKAIGDFKGHIYKDSLEMNAEEAQEALFKRVYNSERNIIEGSIFKNDDSSLGMAKLFVRLPLQMMAELTWLLNKVPKYDISSKIAKARPTNPHPPRRVEGHHDDDISKRVELLRKHQKETPLPIDAMEPRILFSQNTPVSIICGGTGSGKVRNRLLVFVSCDKVPKKVDGVHLTLASLVAAVLTQDDKIPIAVESV